MARVAAPSLRVVRRPKGSLVAAGPRALTAASAPVTDPLQIFKSGTGGRRNDWQAEAWEMFRCVGELRYYVGWQAASCSKVRFVASEIDDDSGLPTGSISEDNTEGQQVAEIVRGIAGGPLGQSQLVKRITEVLAVPGEVWVAILILPEGERWFAVTRREIERGTRSNSVVIKLPDGRKHDFDQAAGDGMFRIWNHDAEDACQPDSPVRACLDPLREIVQTTRKIRNADLSRLIGNGVFLIPQEASLPDTQGPVSAGKPGDPPDPTVRKVAEKVQEMFVRVASTAVQEGPGSMASLVPIVMAVPGDHVDKVKHVEFANDVTDIAIKTRNDAIARLAMGLNTSPERLLGMGDTNHWCVDSQTEVLSERGWLSESDLEVGDVVLTLNHETGLSEWKPVLDIYRANVTDEPMREMATSRHNSLTTLHHRWPVLRSRGTPKLGSRRWDREWTTTENIGEPHKIITAVPNAEVPTEAKYIDDFVELVGWYWTEGSHSASGQVTIAQSHTVNADRVERIRALLTRTFGPEKPGHGGTWHSRIQNNDQSHGGPVTVFNLNGETRNAVLAVVPGRDKIVPTEWVRELTSAQLRLFVEVSCLGDGWHLRHGVTDIWQKNGAALDAFELALILSGVAVSRRSSGDGEAVRALKVETQSPGRGVRGNVVRSYTGVVWCPTTENHTWFARRNGQVFYTGNSSRGIGDDDVQMHIAPVMETICQAFYDNVLANMLTAAGIDPTKYVLWYDTSSLTVDPDKTEEGKDAFINGAITAGAYVRTQGLSDDSVYDFDTMDGFLVFAKDAVTKNPALITTYAPVFAALAGVNFPVAAPALPPGQGDEEGDPSGADRGEEPDTEGDGPDGEASVRGGGDVSMAVELMVTRCLELVGKRRVKVNDHMQQARLRGVPSHEYHRYMPPVAAGEVPKLIKGWDAGLDDIAARYGLDADQVRAVVLKQVRGELTAELVDGQVV